MAAKATPCKEALAKWAAAAGVAPEAAERVDLTGVRAGEAEELGSAWPSALLPCC